MSATSRKRRALARRARAVYLSPFDVLALATGGLDDDDTLDAPDAPAAPTPAPAASPAPALLTLQAQINQAYPLRSKVSDGIMADPRHIAEGKSDHIHGNAFDVTTDPQSGPNNAALAVALLSDSRTHYTIFNGEIRNVEIDGRSGASRPYTGADPHTSHLHVSIYPAGRDDTRQWDLTPGAADALDAAGAPDALPVSLAGASMSEGGGGGAGTLVLLALAVGGLVLWGTHQAPPAPAAAPVPIGRVRRRRAV